MSQKAATNSNPDAGAPSVMPIHLQAFRGRKRNAFRAICRLSESFLIEVESPKQPIAARTGGKI
jgi:hypothetical protein